MMQILIGAAVVVIGIGIAATIMKSGKTKQNQAEALKKVKGARASQKRAKSSSPTCRLHQL